MKSMKPSLTPKQVNKLSERNPRGGMQPVSKKPTPKTPPKMGGKKAC